MQIETITFINGLIVGNITKEQSDRIGLVLFGETRRLLDVAVPMTKAKKRAGWRRRDWNEEEDNILINAFIHGKANGIKGRVIINNVGKQTNRTKSAVAGRITTLKKQGKLPSKKNGYRIPVNIVETVEEQRAYESR